jgi:Alpha/beta hydrolase domain
MRLRARTRMSAVVALVVACAAPGAAGAAEVADPTVTGPVTGGSHGYPWNHSLFALEGKRFDYTEQEYFFGGTATNLETAATAPYRSRMLVRLPRDPADFSGTVLVEWLNVTGQSDLETAWPVEARYLMRHGVGYVGVSAQFAGVCCGPTTLVGWDPGRYGSLSVPPGDLFSYDILSQAIRALRAPQGVDPTGGLGVEDVVVTGASQSALYLTNFVNGGYNRGQIDLYVITRGGGPFADFSTPIFHLNEENAEAPQPDTDRYVAWEEAGTSHAPLPWWGYITREQDRDLGSPNVATAINAACTINRGSVDFSSRALSYWTMRYLADGTMPPSAPRVEREGGSIVRDEHGLAKGGLRQPFVQVPVAYNSSDGCPLYGSYEAWDSDKITSLYPTHADYVAELRAWTRREVRRGWLIEGDRRRVMRRARGFDEPWTAGCDPCEAPAGLGG